MMLHAASSELCWLPPIGRRRAAECVQPLIQANGRYVYRDDLLELGSKIPREVVPFPTGVDKISTTLRGEAWAWELRDHASRQGVCRLYYDWYSTRLPHRV